MADTNQLSFVNEPLSGSRLRVNQDPTSSNIALNKRPLIKIIINPQR